MGSLRVTLVFLLMGSLIYAADGSIHEYNNQSFTKISNARYYVAGSEGIYGSEFLDTPQLKGNSFIRFDNITFVRSKESASKQNSTQATAGLVEAIVFEAKQQDRVGGSFFKTEDMCCTPKLADAGSCNLGEVMISADPNDPEWPKRIPTSFKRGEEEVKMSPEAVIIKKTGWYTVYFMTCDPELDGTTVRGRTVWKNRGGYLQGEKAPLMKFYVFMQLAYAILGLVWFPQVARYWKDGIQLHSHISLVIAFSVGELACLYYDFAYLDSAGTSFMEFTVWAITLSSVRKALSRLLLLVISSGYGIVNTTRGGITLRMLLVGVLCFVISESLGLAIEYGNISENGMTFLMLSSAILEICFLHWIFRSLLKTLTKLKLSKNIAKLQLYKNFANVLVIMVVLNFFWIYVEVYIYESLRDLWQWKWIIPVFWYLLSYQLLVMICFVWPPTDKPTSLLYIADEDSKEGDEYLSLAEAGMMNKKDETKAEDGNVERNERKSLLEVFILLLGH
ncbi:PREDICTED: transmembrane protein 87A-like [Camelina sativa]|uniref:Transmembrane protein 87A-like n=1 Tax=Camelina sativa TaxID=90675 RepID=A0ABM0WTM4_CAMSA|nr:PREDICTED: transmembrane protein 87A-like [Camelina sativa]